MPQDLVVRPLTGRRHPGAEEESGALDLPLALRELDFDREVLGVAAGRENRTKPIVGIAFEVLDQILAGVVFRSPARVPLVSQVRVGVDQGRNDRLSSQVDRGGWRAPFSITPPSPRISRAPSKRNVAPGWAGDADAGDSGAPSGGGPESDGAHPAVREAARPIATLRFQFTGFVFSMRASH